MTYLDGTCAERGASDAVYERAARVAREWAVAKEWREREWADPVRGERTFF